MESLLLLDAKEPSPRERVVAAIRGWLAGGEPPPWLSGRDELIADLRRLAAVGELCAALEEWGGPAVVDGWGFIPRGRPIFGAELYCPSEVPDNGLLRGLPDLGREGRPL